jgi:hypothetical protein
MFMIARNFHTVLMVWLMTALFSAAQADTAIPPVWLQAARDLAQMHYLPGQVGWTGLHTANPQIWWLSQDKVTVGLLVLPKSVFQEGLRIRMRLDGKFRRRLWKRPFFTHWSSP